ncbi:GNAT family N-acetyltransferase [Streptomyces sp. 71268]|uniref:GNAT family N-acetyltransferase n=1 Tax=Streptomyces sp. 71268 TaxID=3002640 RepID=UPI0023F8887F|nr:GNAT family N-acetyltransferase [Streptomyces sp. 71268]WEV24987.1 GNAT family N-acetyltransferase [Streptomyces sp. 71268]
MTPTDPAPDPDATTGPGGGRGPAPSPAPSPAPCASDPAAAPAPGGEGPTAPQRTAPPEHACDDTVDLWLTALHETPSPAGAASSDSYPQPVDGRWTGEVGPAAPHAYASGPGPAAHAVAARSGPARRSAPSPPPTAGLIGDVERWGPATTPFGVFSLLPVSIQRDLPLLTRWMNDPSVAAFWELAGPEHVTEHHLRAQLDGDGRSLPCLGVLDGVPIGYWEVYRADLDPLARHYPARPHDTGLHLLIGGVADRGRGIGTALLRAVADLVLDHRPDCGRVIAEPDLRNTPSIAAFLGAGFRFGAEVALPGKRAALMVRDRALRHLL